jgi:hypothetical protein
VLLDCYLASLTPPRPARRIVWRPLLVSRQHVRVDGHRDHGRGTAQPLADVLERFVVRGSSVACVSATSSTGALSDQTVSYSAVSYPLPSPRERGSVGSRGGRHPASGRSGWLGHVRYPAQEAEGALTEGLAAEERGADDRERDR